MPNAHRSLFRRMLILMTLLTLVACGTPANPPTAADQSTQPQTNAASPAASAATATGDVTTLTFWNGFTGPDRPAIEALVKQFNDTHPTIQVQMEIMPWDSLLQKLLADMTVGQGPDIAGYSSRFLPQYAKAGVIAPLDDLYTPDRLDPAVLPPGLVQEMKYNGTSYAAPMNFATLMLYYNKTLFKEAGLDPNQPPSTWAEWQEAIRKTTKDGQYGLVLADHQTIPMWPILVWGNGGNFVDAAGATSALNDPKTVEALQMWGEMVATDKISPVGLTGAEADKLFETGKAAMEMNGPWMTTGYTKAGLDYDVAPIPAGPAGQVTLADAVVMVLNKNSVAKKDAAYEFFRFWNSKEAQAALAVQTGFPPTRTDMMDAPELAKNPFVVKFAQASPYARFYLSGLENATQIDNEVITPLVQRITQGEASADEAARVANEQLIKLLGK